MYKHYLLLFVLIGVSLTAKFLDNNQLTAHHSHKLNKQNPEHKNLINGQKKIQVHLIPHSHDDVGWLKTVDEYYYGQHNNIQRAGVQYIIDSYIDALLKDQTKKFIQVETAFFKKYSHRWWDEQTLELQNKVKVLVKNGQLEFINGGWCMNDEATTYYEDIIDQMTLGHKFLYDTFRVKPTIGWQIDPFGHQSSQGLLFQQMGFNAWFFARIDYQDKEKRLENKEMEMIMHPFTQSGVDYPIFTHVNYYHYESPPNFNFDTWRDTEPIIDNVKSKAYNVKNRADQFVFYFKNQSLHQRGGVIMHTMGSDFQWSNADMIYKNLDKLMNYINQRQDEYNMEIIYSTPSQYLKALNDQQRDFPTKSDDFFPYADGEHAYWTGYFTSRLPIKKLVRSAGRYSQVVKRQLTQLIINGQCQWVNQNKDQIIDAIYKMDEALGICQHHDAVSGTEKQHVNDDYINIISSALATMNDILNQVVAELVYHETSEETKPQFEQCNWNQTAQSCQTVFDALYNMKAIQINVMDGKVGNSGQSQKIRVKVPQVYFKIVDQENNLVYGDIVCSNDDENDCDLFFVYNISEVNELQYFKLIPTGGDTATVEIFTGDYSQRTNKNPLNLTIESRIEFNGSKPFSINYGYYLAYQQQGQKSGAYIFRPEQQDINTIDYGVIEASQKYSGNMITVITIDRTHTRTTIRQFKHEKDTYEIETFLKSIPVDDKLGKEIVLYVNTDINSENIFYTDSNGLELQQRKVNFRPTWDLVVNEPASGNYYPINGMMLLQDADTKDAAVLLNDRAQGGTSLRKGQFEIMIHRRLLLDDARGVGEPLDEVSHDGAGLTQSVSHTLSFFNRNEQPNHHRKLQYQQDLAPILLFSESTMQPFAQSMNSFKATYPNDLMQIIEQQPQADQDTLTKLYLQPWNSNTYLYRVHNLREVGSQPITFPANVDVTETTLTANQAWIDWQKVQLSKIN